MQDYDGFVYLREFSEGILGGGFEPHSGIQASFWDSSLILNSSISVVRDYDGFVYLREFSGGILGGGFEPHSKPCFNTGIPEKFEFQLLEEDWDHFRM